MGLNARNDGLPRMIAYDGEKTRNRVWQDAQLAALTALIAAHPPERVEIETSPAGIVIYARELVRASFAIADEVSKQHGPSVSARLQKEDPFVAAPGVRDDDADESAD